MGILWAHMATIGCIVLSFWFQAVPGTDYKLDQVPAISVREVNQTQCMDVYQEGLL